MSQYYASAIVVDTSQKAYIGSAWSFKIFPDDSMSGRRDVVELQYTYDKIWSLTEQSSYTFKEVLEGRTVNVTIPVAVAELIPNASSVTLQMECKSYIDDVYIGSSFVTVECYVPDNIAPTCSLSISDAAGYRSKYGAYIYGKSMLLVQATAEGIYGSTIKTCTIEANGQTHTQSFNRASAVCTFTTDELCASGTLRVKATVTDSRGRSCAAEVQAVTLDYTAPTIRKMAVVRCDANGTENRKGDYAKVTFSAGVTSLESRNSAAYRLAYKKTTDTSFTTVELTEHAGSYAVTDAVHIIEADGGFSYNVQIYAVDDFHENYRGTSLSTAFVRMHLRTGINGMGLGKVVEDDGDDLLDIGWRTRFVGGILQVELEAGTDLDDVTTPNVYTGLNASSANYANCPITSYAFTLEVCGTGDGGAIQRLTPCTSAISGSYVRQYKDGYWREWLNPTDSATLKSNMGLANFTSYDWFYDNAAGDYFVGMLTKYWSSIPDYHCFAAYANLNGYPVCFYGFKVNHLYGAALAMNYDTTAISRFTLNGGNWTESVLT